MNLFKFLNSNHLLGLSYGSVGVGAAPPNEGCSAGASTGDYLGLPVEMLWIREWGQPMQRPVIDASLVVI
jgi:hypothetical protein